MIILLVGEDDYRINMRINELKSGLNDPSGLNFTLIDASYDFEKIKNEAETQAFLADKKLIVVKGIFTSKNKELVSKIETWLQGSTLSNDLVFIEKEMKISTRKLFDEIGKIEEYHTLKPYELTKWITVETKRQGGEIAPKEAEKLGLMIGPDLVRLKNEIAKLVAYNPKITEKSIKELVQEGYFDSIFVLMDAVSDKNRNKAIGILDRFLGNDENELYLIAMLARQVRNLITMKSLATQGKSESTITSETKLHPYVVKKTLQQSRNFELAKLLSMHKELLKADIALKGSKLDSRLILDRLIISFTN